MNKVALLLALGLAGCGPVSWDSNEMTPFTWQAANQLCANQGGLDWAHAKNWWHQTTPGGLKVYERLHIQVRCANGVLAEREIKMDGSIK